MTDQYEIICTKNGYAIVYGKAAILEFTVKEGQKFYNACPLDPDVRSIYLRGAVAGILAVAPSKVTFLPSVTLTYQPGSA